MDVVSRVGLSIGGIGADCAVPGREEERKGIAYAQEHHGRIAVPAPWFDEVRDGMLVVVAGGSRCCCNGDGLWVILAEV